MSSIRIGYLRELARLILAWMLLFGAQSAFAQDVNINTPTTEAADYSVNGNLNILAGGSLDVTGSLYVLSDISNNGLPTGISASGNLVTGGNVLNGVARQFVVEGANVSSIAGELNNLGTFTFGASTLTWSQLQLGSLTNAAGAHLLFLPGATLSVTGAITNAGDVTFQQANVATATGQTLDNSGTWAITQGSFVNRGTIDNTGLIVLANGNFSNLSGSTMSGDGQLIVNGTATFYSGSTLQGTQTITANTVNLQGVTTPGTAGTIGQLTFDAATNVQGTTTFDLVTPWRFSTGSDQIVMAGGHTGTIGSGARFTFSTGSSPGNIGDKYRILSGNISLNNRPIATDDAPDDNRRIVLRTNYDTLGFSNQGTAYYALTARNESFEQIAVNNNGKVSQIAMGRYLDRYFPRDDHTIGTTNADLQWIRDTLDLMPNESDVVYALGQMTGEVYAPLASVAMQRQFFAYNQLAGHLREELFQPCSLDQVECRSERVTNLGMGGAPDERAWIAGYGFGGSIAGGANAYGCTYGGGGVQIAYGYQIVEQVMAGMFYDFGTFDLTNDVDNRADARAHSLGGYLTWHRDFDYLMFVAGGGFADYHASRRIDFASTENVITRTAEGRPQGGQAAFYTEYGLNVPWENVHLRPYVGLLYMNVLQEGFEETGANSLDLRFEQSTVNSLRTLVGSQLDLRFAPIADFVWTVRGVWMHEYIDEATAGTLTTGLAAIPNSGFTLARPATGADWFVGGVGLRGAFYESHFRPFANYDLAINAQQAIHAGLVGIECVW